MANHAPARHAARRWLTLVAAGIFLCFLSIRFLDEPIARFFFWHLPQYPLHGLRIGTAFVVAPVVAALLIAFCLRGRIAAKTREILIIAAYSALSGLAINDFFLKPFFARETVDHFIMGYGGFFRAHDARAYSFPSGHSVLVAAILFTLWQRYPRGLAIYVVAMVVVALMLMAGDWHFLSDIIAGTLLGAASAFVTDLLWRRQTRTDN